LREAKERSVVVAGWTVWYQISGQTPQQGICFRRRPSRDLFATRALAIEYSKASNVILPLPLWSSIIVTRDVTVRLVARNVVAFFGILWESVLTASRWPKWLRETHPYDDPASTHPFTQLGRPSGGFGAGVKDMITWWTENYTMPPDVMKGSVIML